MNDMRRFAAAATRTATGGLLGGVILLVGLTLGGARAEAQRGIDTELFHPAMDGYGIISVERAETAKQWDFGFTLFANWAGNPLRLSMYDAAAMGVRSQTLMSREIGFDLGMHVGLTNWLELSASMPFSSEAYTSSYGHPISAASASVKATGFYAAEPATNVGPPDAAAGDARVALKARIIRRGLFGLAVQALVTVPFGDDSAFLGDTTVTFRPLVIADITTQNGFTVAVNAGFVVRKETRVFDPFDVAAGSMHPRLIYDVGDEATWGVGARYRFIRYLGVAAEFYGSAPVLTAPNTHNDHTADVLGALQIFPGHDVTVTAAGGANVFASAYRHDEYRVVLGVTWTPTEHVEAAPVVTAGGEQ